MGGGRAAASARIFLKSPALRYTVTAKAGDWIGADAENTEGLTGDAVERGRMAAGGESGAGAAQIEIGLFPGSRKLRRVGLVFGGEAALGDLSRG